MTVDLLRESVQRGKRNVVILRDVRSDLLIGNARQEQVGPICQRRQNRTRLRPTLGNRLHSLAQQRDWILDLPRVAEEIRFHQLDKVRPVGDRVKPGRFDETNQVGRDRHAHFVSSAQQLKAYGGAGLDIAASSVARQGKFHRQRLAFHFPRGGSHQSLAKSILGEAVHPVREPPGTAQVPVHDADAVADQGVHERRQATTDLLLCPLCIRIQPALGLFVDGPF